MIWCDRIRKKFPKLLGKLAFIECPSGWEKLIEDMCLDVVKYETYLVADPDYSPIVFIQIKEKFGGLVAYYQGGHINGDYISAVSDIIHDYEKRAMDVCSLCGAVDSVTRKIYTRGWVYTRCKDCINA